MAQNYECVLLLKPTLTDEAIQGYLTQFSKIITDNKAELVHVHRSNRRRLEYEIGRQREAIFAIFYFRGEKVGPIIEEFERQVRINDDLLREMSVKVPELRIIEMSRFETIPPTREEMRRNRYAAQAAAYAAPSIDVSAAKTAAEAPVEVAEALAEAGATPAEAETTPVEEKPEQE